MRVDAHRPLTHALAWFGLFGSPLAWAALHFLGFGVATAACSTAGVRWGFEVQPWSIALTVATAAIAAASLAAAVFVFAATRGVSESGPPPAGRLHFVAIVGMAIGPIFLLIIVLAGIGGAALGCGQG